MLARAKSWRCLAVLIGLCGLQTIGAWQASAQDPVEEGGAYLLGTASTGGTYHPVGVALSTLVKLKILPEFGFDLTAINTEGSQQNLELIRQNDIQFAIISAHAGHDSLHGEGAFADVGSDEGLRAITTLWMSTDHLLIRGDDMESGTIADFLALKGRPVSLGRRNSSTLIENRTLFSAFDFDIDADFDLIELGYSESAEALATGQIDGMSMSGGVPIGAVQDAFETSRGDVAMLEINDDQLALIDDNRGVWQRVRIPSGTYPGQDRDIFTIGTPNILAVRADVDEEVVYQITRTIFDELEYLHGLHSTTRQINLDSAVSNLPIPVHPGAERYFKEKGVELPMQMVQLDPELLTRYPSSEDARIAANQGVVTMFAGSEGDTTTRVAAELAAVLNRNESDLRLLATNGGGVGQNLTDLLYLKGVDTALVRADMVNYAQEQAVYPLLSGQVNYISEMFPEEVHLLVGSDIEDLKDLTGKKINVGTSGSGTAVTGLVILSELGVRAETTRFEARIAIEKLKQGDISGAIFVGGKPMPLLQQIDQDSGLKLIALPAVDYADSYRTAEFSERDYPNLMEPGGVVPTVAVRTALLTYAWPSGSARYNVLGELSASLFRSLLTLQEAGYHPKWREVDPTAEFASWQRFEPASLWVENNRDAARRIVSEGQQVDGQNAERTEEPAARAVSIETVVEPDKVPDPDRSPDNDGPVETPPASAAIAPVETAVDKADDDTAADAAVIPTAPVIELTPALKPSVDELQTDGIDLGGAGTAQAASPPPPKPREATRTRGISPTF